MSLQLYTEKNYINYKKLKINFKTGLESFLIFNFRNTLRATSSWIRFRNDIIDSRCCTHRLFINFDGEEWTSLWRNELSGFNESELWPHRFLHSHSTSVYLSFYRYNFYNFYYFIYLFTIFTI